MDSKIFAEKIAEIILTKKGFNIKLFNVQKVSSVADYFVICSADSDIQVKAIADEIEDKLGENGIKCFHKEGFESLNWVILDYFDVVIHIFRKSVREYYNLDKLWGDAEITIIDDNEEELH
ncbi:MAG: ribosome silencing factor [Ignavibacteriales bacterium]